MKRILTLLALVAIPSFASAATYTFAPSDPDVDDLDHHYAYTWGINFSLAANEFITGAKLTIKDIWDWRVEKDKLFIDLLDDPKKNVRKYSDNTNDNVIQDYFLTASSSVALGMTALTTWYDPFGGNTSDKTFDFIYNFTADNITTLTNYITDPTADYRAAFGFGFDPDCHYYNNGICFEITTETRTTRTVPDGAATVSLFGASLLGLAYIRRRVFAKTLG